MGAVASADLSRRVLRRLTFLYGPERAPALLAEIAKLVAAHRPKIAPAARGWGQADVLLITYADSLLGEERPLRTLADFLGREARGLTSFVHLLPFYPYSSDDGFSVVDYRAVRGDLGGWEDVRALGELCRPVFDGVFNHASSESAYIRGHCAGDERHSGFAIAVPPGTDTSKVLRTRNLPLLHEYQTVRGSEWLWTTFSRDQVDLNFANPKVLLEILDVLLFYAAQGAAMIRLDAVPYMWKKLGTSCAHLEETHELIRLMRDVCDAACPHVLLLAETNAPHRDNFGYLGPPEAPGTEAQLIYNFCLPPLVLWSLHRGDATHLSRWAAGLESLGGRATYLNVTATHDGIGMRPTEGLLSEPERAELVALAKAHGGDVTGRRNPDGSTSPYELNLSYFDAVNDPRAFEPDELRVARFMCSQAVPLALAGIPGIYIHSLLGSRNDLEGVKRTGRARSINRAQLRLDAVRKELADPGSIRAQVFAAYRRLLEIRGEQPAFHPDAAQEVLDLGPSFFALRRSDRVGGQSIIAVHNVTGRPQIADLRAAGDGSARCDLLSGENFSAGDLGAVGAEAYQVRWLAGK